MSSLVRTVAPTLEPVRIDEVKAQARVEIGDEDELIAGYIAAARQWAEDFTARAFLAQTWQQQYDWRFPCEIYLRRGPVTSVSSIAYVDENGVTQTLGATVYQTDLASDPARVMPAHDQIWPITRNQYAAVTATYVSGYGATAASVPQPIRNAISMMAAYWFDQRTPVAERAMVEVPWGAKALLQPYRQTRWMAA